MSINDIQNELNLLKTKSESTNDLKTINALKNYNCEILYQSQHAFGIGKIWDKHYKAFAKFLYNIRPESIIEIGGATEKLANKYLTLQKADWTVIEPNPTKFENEDIKVINGFFEDTKVKVNSNDTIVFSHVLEHAYNPTSFLKKIFEKIHEGQSLIFSYPRLEIWLIFQ